MRGETGNAVVVRPWQGNDRDALAEQANSRQVWINMRDGFPHPFTVEDADRFIQRARGMVPQTFLAVEVDGVLAGGIGYTLHDDVERIAAEVGYWLGTSFWGRGIATTALRLVTSLAFSSHPDLLRLYALPFSSNPASARVLEKAGYQREGVLRHNVIKDGIVLDSWVFAILREEAEA